jgi:hypothetical protein
MKITYSILALLFIAILWTWTQMPEISTNQELVTELPWIIKTDEQGGSEVFGLAIENATVRQAQQRFNDEAEFGIFLDKDGTRSLEAFFNHTYIAGLQARITLTLETSENELRLFAEQAIDKKAQPSNSYKLVLPSELNETLFNHRFSSITYQPKIKIEHEILIARFGKPDITTQPDSQTLQWHYPDKGLMITLVTDQKPVFHYVRPDQYNRYFSIRNSGAAADRSQPESDTATATGQQEHQKESDIAKD